jgi:ABC-type Fe3+-siderophore transport system permease subunit
MQVLSYLFWPRPPQVGYDNPKIQLALAVATLLVVGAIAIRLWRKKLKNAQTKKLSRSWSASGAWFGCIAFLLAVSRAEDISYLSMRFLWIVWLFVLLLYVVLQVRLFRSRHYETLPRETVVDPREKYLPKKKR